jgi:hypothetical protein
VSERISGKTKNILKKLNSIKYDVSNFDIPQGDDKDSDPENVIKIHKLFLNEASEIPKQIKEIILSIDINFSESEVHEIEKLIEAVLMECKRAYVMMQRGIMIFRIKCLEEISIDDKRFFKKIKQEERDQRFKLLEMGERLSGLIDSLKESIDELEESMVEYFDSVISTKKHVDKKMVELEEIEKEERKNNGILDLYKAQMQVLLQAKKEGFAIESEIFSMREKLLNLEKQENSAMLQDLIQTLDSI